MKPKIIWWLLLYCGDKIMTIDDDYDEYEDEDEKDFDYDDEDEDWY